MLNKRKIFTIIYQISKFFSLHTYRNEKESIQSVKLYWKNKIKNFSIPFATISPRNEFSKMDNLSRKAIWYIRGKKVREACNLSKKKKKNNKKGRSNSGRTVDRDHRLFPLKNPEAVATERGESKKKEGERFPLPRIFSRAFHDQLIYQPGFH